MNFGEYIKDLRTKMGLSQRELSEKSGLSNAEISRLETGERKKPSPKSLKAIAYPLGVAYEELMTKAGYMERVIPRGTFEDVVWEDDSGAAVYTIRRQIAKITSRDKDLISILDRALDKSSEQDVETIKKLLTSFMDDSLDETQKVALRAVIDSFSKK